MLDFVQQLVSGVALGCVYGLIALGFVLVYKATEVVNFAQGDLMMLGGFFAFTFIGLLGAHVLVIFPYGLRRVLAALTTSDPAIERAAISLGASQWTVFRRVLFPLMIPGVAGGWVISFIQSFDEVTMTVFVATPSSMTLPVRMYHYIEESIDPLVASVSTVVILLTFLLMAIVDRIYGLDRILVGKG